MGRVGGWIRAGQPALEGHPSQLAGMQAGTNPTMCPCAPCLRSDAPAPPLPAQTPAGCPRCRSGRTAQRPRCAAEGMQRRWLKRHANSAEDHMVHTDFKHGCLEAATAPLMPTCRLDWHVSRRSSSGSSPPWATMPACSSAWHAGGSCRDWPAQHDRQPGKTGVGPSKDTAGLQAMPSEPMPCHPAPTWLSAFCARRPSAKAAISRSWLSSLASMSISGGTAPRCTILCLYSPSAAGGGRGGAAAARINCAQEA